MPDVTTTELVVTGYVYERFEGVHYDTYTHSTGTYYTFDTAPNERWVDVDNDGFFDYGRRDEGYGHWSTFDGFAWRDSNGRVIDEAPDEGASSTSTAPLLDQSNEGLVETYSSDWFF